ncbi:MAG TPA: hypothetical protein PLS94_06655, partial [Prolixibacteraceae bacterium]|nr:hypothetical protein [Prolixibacteraceae bacterium]
MRNKTLNFILSIFLIISSQFTLAIDNFTPTPSNTNGRLQNEYISFSSNNTTSASDIASLSD